MPQTKTKNDVWRHPLKSREYAWISPMDGLYVTNLLYRFYYQNFHNCLLL